MSDSAEIPPAGCPIMASMFHMFAGGYSCKRRFGGGKSAGQTHSNYSKNSTSDGRVEVP